LALLDHFVPLADPRVERSQRHKLLDVIAVALCAILGGADDWVAVERFGRAKLDWLRRFLELPNGIPAHDTFGRIFALIDPEQFEACFRGWVAAVADLVPGQVAIDGKALRGSRDGRGRAEGLAPGQRLGRRGPPDVGPGRRRWQEQRDHGHPQVAGAVGLGRGRW